MVNVGDKIYRYWLKGSEIQKEEYSVIEITHWNIRLRKGKYYAYVTESKLDNFKVNNSNIWLTVDDETKVKEYYIQYLEKNLLKAKHTVESYEQRIQDYKGIIISRS